MLENIGFGGEWYGSHDVEEYLKTKGIFLDGQSSFVEVDPSVLPRIRARDHPDRDRDRNRTGDNTNTTMTGITTTASSTSTRSPHEHSVRTPIPPLLADLFDPFDARELGDLFAGTDAAPLFPGLQHNHATQKDVATADPWAAFTAAAAGQNALSTAFVPGFGDLLARRPSPVMFDVDQFLRHMVGTARI